ncbi:Flowering time control protein FCA [Dendrobium catenatum]|uniref:Flowering time control protein FCA n=1 Tax=Dendrobium catenatum TaxID=906689 RepID=A0A2I0WFS5_9ASPA|nr:Flowering time control protein FCA [Dendrobium catenatum]
MDMLRVERSGERLSERPGDHSGDAGRLERMPSRWSSGSPTNQHNRYLRGGVGDVGGNDGFTSGRYHPYRGQPNYPTTGSGYGGGPGFHGVQGLPDGVGGFGGHQMPMGGNKRGFEGIGESIDYGEGNKFAKLFIGSVPRTTTEEDLRPLFEEHGYVIEVALIRDRRTGQQQGCCFIKYATLEHADRAISALHNRYTLPGGTGPIQVRYADGERERLVEEKLFVASLNKRATEKEVEEIFAAYGHVEDVYLMKDEMKQSRGCGFIKFSSRDMALAALNALHGSYVMKETDMSLLQASLMPLLALTKGDFSSKGYPTCVGGHEGSKLISLQLSNLEEQGVGHMPHNAWDSFNPPLQPVHGFGSRTAVQGGIAPTSAAGSGSFGGVAPTNGTMPNLALISSTSQQSFTPSIALVPPTVGLQMLPLQKSLMASQNLSPSLTSPDALISSSNTQAQTLEAPFQQLGQLQIPQSMGLNSLNQGLLAQQFPGLRGQVSASSSLTPHNATAAAMQNSLGLQQQGLAAVPSQQQLPACNIPQQLVQQSMQQLPSQTLLQQQGQTLQSSYQSSQMEIFQIQQQLQMMQQSNLSQQLNSLAAKQQTPWTGQTQWTGPPPNSSASANTAAVPVNTAATAIPSTISATPSHPSSAPAGAVTLSCNWTEHTSPEGFKYYYNSATRESKWEKPEDLTLFEQQQQQQKLFILQQQQQQLLQQQHQLQKIAPQQRQSPSHTPSQALVHTMQQASQVLVQPQMQQRQQAQIQVLQPTFADLSYAQLHGASSVTDSAGVQRSLTWQPIAVQFTAATFSEACVGR